MSELLVISSLKYVRITKGFSWNDGDSKYSTAPQNIIKVLGIHQDKKWGKKNPVSISDGET